MADTPLMVVVWSLVRTWGGRITSLLVFLVLTRYLAPADIGVAALVSSIVMVVAGLTDMGLAEYLIYKSDSERERNQIFWFQLLVSVLVMLLFELAVPAILRLSGYAEAAQVALMMGVMLPINALARVQDALQRKALQYKGMAIRSLLAVVIAGVVGCTMAVNGFGFWSIAVKHLLEVVIVVALLWGMSDWRPSWRFSWDGFADVFQYGRSMMVGRCVEVLTTYCDDLIVGFALGKVDLGFYAVGKKIYQLLVEMVMSAVSQASGPLFANAKAKGGDLPQTYLLALRSSSWVVLPFFAAVYAVADTVVPLLFGQIYANSVWIVRVYCLVGMLLPFWQFVWSILMAAANASAYMVFAMIRAGLTVSLLLLGSLFGLKGLVWSALLIAILLSICSLHIVKRKIRLRYGEQLGAMRASLNSLVFFGLLAWPIAVWTNGRVEQALSLLLAILFMGFVLWRFYIEFVVSARASR